MKNSHLFEHCNKLINIKISTIIYLIKVFSKCIEVTEYLINELKGTSENSYSKMIITRIDNYVKRLDVAEVTALTSVRSLGRLLVELLIQLLPWSVLYDKYNDHEENVIV